MQQPFSFLLLFAMALLTACSNSSPSNPETTAPPTTEGLIKVNGTDLFYKTIGEGEPMIVVHGGPGLDHSYLLPQMEILASQYQLIFYDQRACGKSSSDVDTSTISIDSFIQDIEALRQKLDLDKIHLLGHSWGGLLSMHYAINFSQHLNSLILLNAMSPSSQMGDQEDSILRARQDPEMNAAFAEIMATEAYKNKESSAYEKIFRVMFRREFYNKDYADDLTLDFPKDFAKNSGLLQHLGKDISEYNILEDLSKITCPTLIVYGDQEPLAKIAGDSLKAKIPNSEYQLIKNCGHFPYIEAQEELLAIITKFKENK